MNIQAEKLIELIKETRHPKRERAKFICVSSGKGGVGKTNFSVNLSLLLANKFNKKVLLLDGDIGLGNVHIILGINPEKNLKQLMKEADIKNIIQKFNENLDVLLGFSGIDSFQELESLDTITLINKLENISNGYDYVILDAPAGINENVLKFAVSSDVTYVITTPEPTAITDAYALIKSLYKLYKFDNIKLIANMCRNSNEGFSVLERVKRSCMNFLSFQPKIAGILPESNSLKSSVRKKNPVSLSHPGDSYVLSLIKIATLETGETVKPDSPSFWKKFKNFISKGK